MAVKFKFLCKKKRPQEIAVFCIYFFSPHEVKNFFFKGRKTTVENRSFLLFSLNKKGAKNRGEIIHNEG